MTMMMTMMMDGKDKMSHQALKLAPRINLLRSSLLKALLKRRKLLLQQVMINKLNQGSEHCKTLVTQR